MALDVIPGFDGKSKRGKMVVNELLVFLKLFIGKTK